MKKHPLLILLLGLVAIPLLQVGCSDPWDEHARELEGATNEPLLERLEQDPETSAFVKLLESTGMDSILNGNNAYTVFAPDNESLQAAAIPDDPTALVNLLKNHIAVSTHRINPSADTVYLTMLSGKILDFVSNEIDGASFIKADQAGSDGIYHVINQVLNPRQSLWEYMQVHSNERQQEFILGLNDYNLYDTAVMEDPEDFYLNNEFLREVGDVRDENQRFTYFVLDDADYEQEVNAFLPYVNYRNHADSSYAISQFHTVKDLLFQQAYDPENLPSMLFSASGVPFPVDKSAISHSLRLSNGWVHFLNRPTLPIANKLLDVYLQGEEPSGFSESVTASTFHRDRQDPYGEPFRDIMVQNHGVTSLGISYNMPRMYATTYSVYWRAVNDLQANIFHQRLGMFAFDAVPSAEDPEVLVRPEIYMFPYVNVEQNYYNEVYLGDFSLEDYDRIVALLQGAATTNNGENTLVLDYLRFVPKVRTN